MNTFLNDKSIIICGIVRNAEKGLINNIPVIRCFCKYFKDYHVVIYENNSVDKTKKLLAEWMKADATHVHCIMENVDATATIPKVSSVSVNPFYSHKRINKMAYLRNQYMDYIASKEWTADYLMVVDMDVARLDVDGILTSFNVSQEWDALTAFGYSTSPKLCRRFHDTYALTEYGDEQNPQTESKIKTNADKYGTLHKGMPLVRVFSAFGGLAIYRYEAVRGLRYDVYKNDDSRVEVRCEHYSIYKQMKDRGYDKVYINPNMSFKYQNLTMRIVWNSLKRRIFKCNSFL